MEQSAFLALRSNIMMLAIKLAGCTNDKIPNALGICQCPKDTFDTEIACIQCFHPKYFDYSIKQCLSCPINQIYNIQ